MRKILFVIVLLTIAGLLAYSDSFNVPFQLDGPSQIEGNPMIKSLDNFAPVLDGHAPHPPSGSVYNNRRFVGYLTLALSYHFGGLDVEGYHIVNLVIHITNGLLVYFFIILTFKTPFFSDKLPGHDEQSQEGDDPINTAGEKEERRFFRMQYLTALFAALLFVVHPVQTQAVTYIVQRFTSLAAMFYLLSMVMYIKFRLKPRSFPSALYALCSLLSAVLAMLTKEIAFTLPLMVILYEFFFFKAPLRKRLLFILPVFLTIVIIPLSVMGTHWPLGDLLSDLSARTRVQTSIPRWDYLMTQMRVITTYIRLIFLPVNQNLDYDYPVYHSLFTLPVLLSFLFLMAILGIGGYLLYRSGRGKRRMQNAGLEMAAVQGPNSRRTSAFRNLPSELYYRLIAFGIFWFFITLSVESSVIPIADVIFEHRVYLPSVGAFMAVSAAGLLTAGKLVRPGRVSRKAIPLLSVVAVVLLAGATYARNTVWENPVRLWQDVLQKSPGSARAHNDLGYLYLTEGKTDKAIRYFRQALRIRPFYANAHTNLGVAYYEKGWLDDAIEQYRKALSHESYVPDIAEDHHNLGIAFTRKGMLDEAISEFRKALKFAPRDPGIYNDLGFAYRQKGLNGKAIECFRKALGLDPDYVFAHLNLAGAYESEGRYEEAKEHYDMARRLRQGK